MSAGYTDITPAEGLLVGARMSLRWLLVDDAGAPLPGQRANITLTLTEPDGTEVTKTDTDLTDEGAGYYAYSHEFDQVGLYRGFWKFDNSTADTKPTGFLLDVSPLK